MLVDIHNVFQFLNWIKQMTEYLYTHVAFFVVALYILGVSALVRLVYWLMGADREQ